MGRKLIGIYSVFGLLVYVGFVIFSFMYALFGSKQFYEMFRSVVWVIATLPLVFMVYFDVKNRNKLHPPDPGKMEIGKMPLFWIIIVGAFGPIAGFIYFYMTRNLETIPKQETDNLRVGLVVAAWLFALLIGTYPIWGYYISRLILILLIISYLGINGYAIYRMKMNTNYAGFNALIAAFILGGILFYFFGRLIL